MYSFFSKFKLLFLEQIEGIYYGDVAIMLIAAGLICFVPGYALHIKKGISWRKIFQAFFLLMYLEVILALTIFRRKAGLSSGEINSNLNLGFTSGSIYSLRETIYSIMNVLLFVPWGIVVGLYRKSQRPFRILVLTTLTGFITSSLIEIIQLFTGRGRFEVTDLFTNVVGTFLGALFVVCGGIIANRMARK